MIAFSLLQILIKNIVIVIKIRWISWIIRKCWYFVSCFSYLLQILKEEATGDEVTIKLEGTSQCRDKANELIQEIVNSDRFGMA